MRTFMTFLTAASLATAAGVAAARDFPWGRPGISYANTFDRPTATRYYRAPTRTAAPMVAATPSAVTGTRSLSVEPGAAPSVRNNYGHPRAYRAAHPNTPIWLLPKSDPHRYVTGY